MVTPDSVSANDFFIAWFMQYANQLHTFDESLSLDGLSWKADDERGLTRSSQTAKKKGSSPAFDERFGVEPLSSIQGSVAVLRADYRSQQSTEALHWP